MLRKRPAAPSAPPPQQGDAGERASPADLQPWDPDDSLVHHPSFRAPQFGIRPRMPAPVSITVQRAGRRRPHGESN